MFFVDLKAKVSRSFSPVRLSVCVTKAAKRLQIPDQIKPVCEANTRLRLFTISDSIRGVLKKKNVPPSLGAGDLGGGGTKAIVC